MRYRQLLPFVLGAMLVAGCYDSTESRPRTANQLRNRPTDYTDNADNASSNSTPSEGGKLQHGANPKTGKP